MKQLSLIVPVYHIEKYIRPCIESIFRQGLKEESFEVIIVNDGTQICWAIGDFVRNKKKQQNTILL